MRGRSKLIIIALLLLSLCGITGCWDSIQIEERAFVLGIALDKGSKPDEIKLTYQIAIPKAMAGGAESGGGAGQAFYNVSAEGKDFMSADREIESKVDRIRDFEHLQVILIGEGLARSGISKWIDPLVRNNQMRRRTYVLIASGDASKILEIKPPFALTPAMYLQKLVKDNEERTLNILAATDIGKLALNNRRRLDYVLARVEPTGKNELMINGTGVFKRSRLIGWFSGNETGAVKLLQGEIPFAPVTFPSPNPRAGIIAVQIYEGKQEVKPELRNGKVIYKVKFTLDGDIAATQNREFNTLNDAYLTEVSKAFDKYIKQQCQAVFKKAQDEYDADVFDFGRMLHDYDYNYWQKHQGEYNKIFRNAKLEIKVEMKIRRTGLVS